MKKVFVIILSILLIFSMVSCGKDEKPEETDTLSKIYEKGYIVIATEGDWAPWTYHDDDDNLTGFDVELGKLIAAKMGVEAKFEETLWDSILAGIDSGRFDTACNGVGYSESRAEKYYFSTPYVYMGTVLVVRADDTSINSFEDLKGKQTANTASSTYAQIAENYGASVTPVDNLADTINLLLDGRIDATVNAAGSITDYISQHPEAKIRIAATTSEDVEMDCIPFVKADKSLTLMAKVNEILDELRESGELAALSVKYFGVDYTKE